MKIAYIIHGWEGSPDLHWYPWLKNNLEKLGWQVVVPSMPNTDEPKIGEWVEYLSKVITNPGSKTYLVGHSIGCQAIMRYLELNTKVRLGGIVYVAGWISLKNLDSPEQLTISDPWLNTPINVKKVKRVTKNVTAIFSDNDQFVPYEENVAWFKEKMEATIVVEHGKGHMIDIDGVTALPSALKALTK